jgi:beta-glucanase (GH16 family)
MSGSLAAQTQVLLSDNFSDNAPLNPAVWGINQYAPVNNPSYYGRTQIEQYLPTVSNGALQLTLQTYNPTGPGNSFLGSEIISNQTFSDTIGGIAFTAVARIVDPVPGMVGGIFAYSYNSSTGLDNELDFESLSNDAAAGNNQAQTNVYSDQPLGAGNPEFVPDPSLTAYQTYTMEWFPNEVLWFIDGQLVRESTSDIPQGSMAFHLNFWAPDTTWADAYSASLQPASAPQNNTTYTFDVASVSVAEINDSPPVPGFAAFDTTLGQAVPLGVQPYTGPVSGLQYEYINVTSDNLNISVSTPNWFIHSGSGEDAIAVSSGTNVLDGSTGSNFLTGGSGNDTFFVDDRGPTADIWDTVNNFHVGDAATIWGVTPQDFGLNWVDGQGASGYTGLTLHATESGAPTASLTLVGYTTADLQSGRLSVSFGTDPASGSNYMYVHDNS